MIINKLLKVKVSFLLFLYLSVFLFISCGKKGPLYLPEVKRPAPLKDILYFQYDKDFIVTWLSELNENNELRSNNFEKLEFYYSLTSFTDKDFKKKAKVLKKIKNFTDLTQVENRSVIKLDVEKLLDIKAKKYYFALRYKMKKGKWSVLSSVQEIILRRSLMPVKNLKGKQLSKAVVLKWNKCLADYENRVLLSPPKYNIYRKLISNKEDVALNNNLNFYRTSAGQNIINGYQKINNEPVENNYFEDINTDGNGDYLYLVTAIYGQSYESSPSNICKVHYKDEFPPSIPQNVAALKAPKHLFIIWEEVGQKDLSHYNIYRREKEEKDFKLLGKSKEANYKDVNVKPGGIYFYMITSVDKQGNESDYSYLAKGKF